MVACKKCLEQAKNEGKIIRETDYDFGLIQSSPEIIHLQRQSGSNKTWCGEKNGSTCNSEL